MDKRIDEMSLAEVAEFKRHSRMVALTKRSNKDTLADALVGTHLEWELAFGIASPPNTETHTSTLMTEIVPVARIPGLLMALADYMLSAQERYFKDVEPRIERLEITWLDGPPARLLLDERVLKIDPSVASHPRIVRVAILHELINHKLHREGKLLVGGQRLVDFNREAYESLVRLEVERIYWCGAYRYAL